MSKTLYLGFDECLGSNRNDKTTITMAISRDPSEVISEKDLNKRRDLDQKVLEQEFLYIMTAINRGPVFHQAARKLMHIGIERFYQDQQRVIFLFDRNDNYPKIVRNLQQEPHSPFTSIELVKKGDKRIPLLNRADHLANMIFHYHSSSPKSQERIKLFRAQYPRLDQRLIETRIEFPEDLRERQMYIYS